MAEIKELFPEPTVPTTATNWPGLMSRFTLKEKVYLKETKAVIQEFKPFLRLSMGSLVLGDFPSRLENLSWIYKTPKCFLNVVVFVV